MTLGIPRVVFETSQSGWNILKLDAITSFLVISMFVFPPSISGAAEVSVANGNPTNYDDSFDEHGCQVVVSGEIVAGDLERLSAILETGINADASGGEVPGVGARLCLRSNGGSLSEAIKMAKLVKEKHAATVVPPHSSCESACAIVFMAGNTNFIPDRSIYPSSRLGFHAPKLLLSGAEYKADEVSAAYDLAIKTIAEVSALEIMSSYAMTLFSSTPSNTMRYIETFKDIRDGEISLLAPSQEYPSYPSKFKFLPDLPFEEMVLNSCRHIYNMEYSGRNPVFRKDFYGEASGHKNVDNINFVDNNGAKVTGDVPIWSAEESFGKCAVEIDLNVAKAISYGGDAILNQGGSKRFEATSFWPDNARIDAVSSMSMDSRLLQSRLRGIRDVPEHLGCALNSNLAVVVNVEEYVNIRSGASLFDPIVTSANRGARVKIIKPNTWWFKETRRGSQCSKICKDFSSSQSSTYLALQVEECIDEKEIWANVSHNGREGYVSVYFLEAVR